MKFLFTQFKELIEDIKLKTIEDLKIYNFDTFFCYSPYEKDFYTEKKSK